MEIAVVESVSLKGLTMKKIARIRLSSKSLHPPSPPPLLLTKTDRQKLSVEATMVVTRIKNNSTSLVQDLEMRNMKLANYP